MKTANLKEAATAAKSASLENMVIMIERLGLQVEE